MADLGPEIPSLSASTTPSGFSLVTAAPMFRFIAPKIISATSPGEAQSFSLPISRSLRSERGTLSDSPCKAAALTLIWPFST